MTEHDETVEKVARAIYEVHPHYDLDQGFAVMSWDDLVAFEEGADYTPTVTIIRDKASAAIAAMGDGFDAREYLIRNALQPAFPGISPLPSLAGVCTQVDHILAGQQAAIAEAYVLLWSIVTDDPRQHRARHILLDAMGGQGSTRQKLAMEKYGAER